MNKFEKEYHKKKLKYLQNKPAETRYVMQDIGEGFVILDTLSHMNHEYDNDYMLLTNMFGERREVDKGYKTKEEFMELLNDLDRTVNGHLYNTNHNLLLSKHAIYKQLESKLDLILNEKASENFKITHNSVDFDTETMEQIEISVGVNYNGVMPMVKCESPFLENLLSNQVFDKVMVTINRYQDELEQSKDDFDSAKVDALIELKTRIFEEAHKDTNLKQILNFM